VSLFALFCNHKYTLSVIGGLLAIYTAILILGNGYAEDANTNVLARVDLRLFGYDHIYHKSPVDPEGLMGTISSVAHVLLGFYCGMLIRKRETVEQKVIALFVVGAVCVIGGYLLSYGLPLNKRIWSPSYVLMTCGLASLLQALLMYVIDIQKKSGWTTFFHVFGVNALALYVSSELLAILLKNIEVSEMVYNGIHTVIAPLKWASFAYAVYFVLLNFAIGYVLYRKKIYIKL
jgi:predicted acyltransferase